MFCRTLQIGLSRTCRTVLWLVCGLTLLGLCWRESPEIRSPGAASALIVWSGVVLILSRLFDSPVEKSRSVRTGYFPIDRLRSHSILIPALILGVLLPLPWFPFHALFLGLIEATFCLRERRRTKSGEFSGQPAPIDDFPEEESFEEEESANENTIQQTTRFRTEEGTDRFEGSYFVEFRDDQKTTSVHVPFCPMFDSAPKIEAFLLDVVDAKLTIGQSRPFGVRVDVKRAENAPPRFPIMVVAESGKITADPETAFTAIR